MSETKLSAKKALKRPKPESTESPAKKAKTELKPKKTSSEGDQKKNTGKPGLTKSDSKAKFSKPTKNGKSFKPAQKTEKPADWNEFKKQKKELKAKRKQTKSFYEIITQAKKIGEELRVKKLEGGTAKRNELVNKLHEMLGGQGNYVKFVLAHDMARIVQYILKFGSEKVRKEVAAELIPETVKLLISKYGKFVVKRMLKYGNAQIRSDCIKAMYGNAVKLTSHAVSAPVFEFAYSTYASPIDKINLIQEFFGDMYKQTKDVKIKHLRDVYKASTDMKSAALGAVKSNLSRVLNKDLLDSGLIQSVLAQYLSECSKDDKAELITQLAPHVVILSNSKDGSRVVMQIMWNGTNKDKKVALKALKEHVIELCKHEYGHCAVVGVLDSVDDTVLLNKLILSEIYNHWKDLLNDEWGRKVLVWLVSPGDTTFFHKSFTQELTDGRLESTCKKDPEIRRKEILDYSSKTLLTAIIENAKDWLCEGSKALAALAVLKSGEEVAEALKAVSEVIVDDDFKLSFNNQEVVGIEHPALHTVLKKLAQNDKNVEIESNSFGKVLFDVLDADVLKSWLKLNRGCFLLLNLLENNKPSVQSIIKNALKSHLKVLHKQDTAGAKLLLKNLTE